MPGFGEFLEEFGLFHDLDVEFAAVRQAHALLGAIHRFFQGDHHGYRDVEIDPDPESQLYIPPSRIDELSEPFGNSVNQTRSSP